MPLPNGKTDARIDREDGSEGSKRVRCALPAKPEGAPLRSANVQRLPFGAADLQALHFRPPGRRSEAPQMETRRLARLLLWARAWWTAFDGGTSSSR